MKNLFSLLIVATLVLSSVPISAARIVSDVNRVYNGQPTGVRQTGDAQTVASFNNSAEIAIAKAQWGQFSKNLVRAFKSSNEGVMQAAMRYIIQYSDNIDVTDAVFDVMRIYRNDSDSNRRRMAVVTLAHMNSDWAIAFLKRSAQFEKSEVVVSTILAVLADARTQEA